MAAGSSGVAVSSRSVEEAIDAVANHALAQHAVVLEQQKARHASLLAKVTDVVSEARPLVAHKVVGGAAQELVDVAEAHLARKGGGALLGDGYRSGQGEGESVAKVHPAREGGRALQRVGVLEGASRDEGQG